ncbi:MAG TPA: hypothetical protein VFF65_09660 [Phycisphaerales bacterium]|nr:hypothetical protein [Phycisphaerales bacterium]
MPPPPSNARPYLRLCALCCTAALMLAGCAEETTVISERGLLLGLPHTERGGKEMKPGGIGGNPIETVADTELVRTTPTGERFLVCQSPRHVIILTRQLLASADEADRVLLYNQLVSDDTKRRAIMEGNDPARVLDYFTENRAEILDLLSAMPMGELSPDISYERVDDGSGRDRERLRVRSSLARKLEFTELWVQREKAGQYRLLWVK